MINKIGPRGDTIIEVLLAMTVIAALIGSAYAAASNSLKVSRAAQERSEATRVVESQLERLKAMAGKSQNPATNIFRTETFCINGSFEIKTNLDECKFNNFYKIAIVYANNSGEDIFTVTATWDRIGGGQDNLTMNYRLHKP